TAARASKDVPLAKIVATTKDDYWYRIASGKGVLALHALRNLLGEDNFVKGMQTFGEENAGKKVTTTAFLKHMSKASGKKLDEFSEFWLQETGLPPKQVFTGATSGIRLPGGGGLPIHGDVMCVVGGDIQREKEGPNQLA